MSTFVGDVNVALVVGTAKAHIQPAVFLYIRKEIYMDEQTNRVTQG